MAFPAFTHIHCSSRFDRSAASLEHDLDEWMAHASVITLTEISDDHRAATMREKGWGNHNAKKGHGADNAGICWNREVWALVWSGVRKLQQGTYMRPQAHKPAGNVHACAVVLKHKTTGHKLLVMVAHMPNDVVTGNRWISSGYDWRARKTAYQTSVKNWSTWTEAVRKRRGVDGVMVVADWNIDLKDNWFRQYLREHWGRKYRLGWIHFPTAGGSLSPHGRIIDGTLARGLKVEDGAQLMHQVSSSDHRPYKERFRFSVDAGDDNDAGGNTREGRPWWGFGDYISDTEKYEYERAFGETGGEVL